MDGWMDGWMDGGMDGLIDDLGGGRGGLETPGGEGQPVVQVSLQRSSDEVGGKQALLSRELRHKLGEAVERQVHRGRVFVQSETGVLPSNVGADEGEVEPEVHPVGGAAEVEHRVAGQLDLLGLRAVVVRDYRPPLPSHVVLDHPSSRHLALGDVKAGRHL